MIAHIFDVVYFSKQPRMDMLYRIQDELLKTVVTFAPIALKEPDNYEARANLMWTSTWALNGFIFGGVEQMTPCHMMEHELSAVYNITHGHGLAILMPRWLKYTLNDDNAWQIKRLGTNVFGIDASLSDREGAEKAIEAFHETIVDDVELYRLAFRAMEQTRRQGEHFYKGGTTELLNKPEFKDVDKAKSLFTMLEEQDIVANILTMKAKVRLLPSGS